MPGPAAPRAPGAQPSPAARLTAPAPGIYAPAGTHRRPPLPSRPKETVTLDPANRERHGQRGATAADAANPRTQQPGGTLTCPGAPRLRRLQPELRTPGNFARRARTCPRCGGGVSLFAKGRPLAAAFSCPSPSARAGDPAGRSVRPPSMTPLTNVIKIVARAPRKGHERCSYALSRASRVVISAVAASMAGRFLGVMPNGALGGLLGLRTRQGGATRCEGRLLLGHVQRSVMLGDGRRIVSRPARMRQPISGSGPPGDSGRQPAAARRWG